MKQNDLGNEVKLKIPQSNKCRTIIIKNMYDREKF